MIKKVFKAGLFLILALILLLVACNFIVSGTTADKTYDTIQNLPYNRVGLVLGTSNKLIGGATNPYYTNRIKATILLYTSKKIEFVLVSGDNGSIYYNEPNTIKKDLVAAGIPADRIFLDYAGFRTLDSMVRAKSIFGLENVTVISQKFHNERAIYIANKKGLNAIGFNAMDISTSQGLKVQVREYFARVKVFIDLIFNTQPKYFGKTIEVK